MIIKRDGRKENFDSVTLRNAIHRAFEATYNNVTEEINFDIDNIVNEVVNVYNNKKNLSVEEIQDIVEKKLMNSKYKNVAKNYIIYRENRNKARKNTIDDTIIDIVGGTSDYWNNENSNKNAKLLTTQRDYIAGAVSTDATNRYLLPKDIVEAHNEGIIHFHDADYFIQSMYNCCLCNLEDMLQNGTVISGIQIDKPHRFSTACNVATQIIAQICSNQYGGQSINISHLSPFVEESRKTFEKKFPSFTKEQIDMLVNNDIEQGVQTMQYQISTLMTTNGQSPFVTLYMNLVDVEEGIERENLARVIEEILKQRMKGIKNDKGVYITIAFPKLIYALDECNIHEDSKYYYLTELSARCSAKRLVPDYVSNKIMKELKNGDLYTPMGCRSFLSVDRFSNTVGNISKAKNFEQHKGHFYFGRFNQGVVTINLVDVACSSNKNEEEFWKIFDDRLELCHRALQCRHKRLLGTKSDVAPILWQNGAIARLDKGETIDKLLFNGYSTISLGYAGLYECVMYMKGVSHTDEKGKEFALKVMQYMTDKCTEWKESENIDYSVYGTPIESTTYKFAKCLKKRFGEIKDVTDHDYITNSYHVCVREEIDAFTKLKLESEFQKLSAGGAISYVEIPNMQNNIEAVLTLIKYIYDTIMYAELNSKSDYCQVCGYEGEIQVKGEVGKLYWECPNCGNTDTNKLNVARRTCGYIGSNFWNQGRTQEIKERVLHL